MGVMWGERECEERAKAVKTRLSNVVSEQSYQNTMEHENWWCGKGGKRAKADKLGQSYTESEQKL